MDSPICKFNPYKNRVLLFPGIYSFHCTRLILSYFTTFELRTIISRLNKWSNLFISQTQNLSVVYGRTDPCISILYRPIEDSPVQLKKFDHEKLKTNIAEISDFPMDLTNFKSVETSKNSVYVIGGMNKLTNQIISFCYKITSLPSIKLQEVCPMNYPRISFSLTSCGLFIYVIGGFYDGTTKICEKLNISANRWEAFPALNIARCNPILCSFNSNIIYAFGGTDGHTPLNSIEKYENSKNQWVLLPPLLQMCYVGTRNGGFARQISAHEILIFGGKGTVYKQPIQQCFIYNAIKEEFVGSNNMEPEKFDNIEAHLENEKLFVIGGNIQYYDCKSKKWTMP